MTTDCCWLCFNCVSSVKALASLGSRQPEKTNEHECRDNLAMISQSRVARCEKCGSASSEAANKLIAQMYLLWHRSTLRTRQINVRGRVGGARKQSPAKTREDARLKNNCHRFRDSWRALIARKVTISYRGRPLPRAPIGWSCGNPIFWANGGAKGVPRPRGGDGCCDADSSRHLRWFPVLTRSSDAGDLDSTGVVPQCSCALDCANLL